MAGDALVGREVGRYHVQAVVGTGGFAVVYRAVDTVLERTVALKVLDPSSHRNPTIGRRFVLEGRAAAGLDHPAIVPVYDAGDHDGLLWLAMRLVEGTSVDQALATGRRFQPDEVAALVDRIGSALDHAHARGVVHRDVKPSNLLLEGDDPYRAHLADFGIAATARTAGRYTTGALGTAAYMAPEQASPSDVGPQADLYSLACVVYEMLTGRRPFPGDDHVALLFAHATHPVPPTGDSAVDAVLARALAKDPADRPPSGAALATELRPALVATDGAAMPAPAAVRIDDHGRPSSPSPAAMVAGATAPTEISPGDATLVQPAGPVEASSGSLDAPWSPSGGHGQPDPAPAGDRGRGRPRDPTVVRRGRRLARQRLVVGALALAVAAVVAIVALLDRGPAGGRRVSDEAGISYELGRGWEVGTVEPPTTTLLDDADAEVVTITHGPARGEDVVDALREAGSLCQGAPEAYDGIAGSTAGARCDNPQGTEPATIVGAVAGEQLWVITVADDVAADERDDFLGSIRLNGT